MQAATDADDDKGRQKHESWGEGEQKMIEALEAEKAEAEKEEETKLDPEDLVKTELRTREGYRRRIHHLGTTNKSSFFRVNYWNKENNRIEDSYFVKVKGKSVKFERG